MFDSIGWPEIMVIVLVGLFIFGPDKLPKLISDGIAMLRQLRRMATNATGDLSRELGTDISVEDLNPKTFVRKHLLSDDDQDTLTRPFKDLYSDVSTTARGLDPTRDDEDEPSTDRALAERRRARFDADTT